tara:strand:- start:291 stop:1196 length:906 start_codon:yes stop_codon:yes gene_type:complete
MTKRAAICFSGQPRISYEAINKLVDNVLNPLYDNGYEIDIFMHFWNEVTESGAIQKSKNKLGNAAEYGINEKEIPNAFQTFLRRFSPKKKTIETKLKKEDFVLGNFRHAQTNSAYNYNSQYHSVKKSHDLCREYEIENNFRYDFVARARTDLSILNPLDYEELCKEAICVPTFPGHHCNMIKEEIMHMIEDESRLKTLNSYAASINVTLSEFVNRMLLGHTFDETKICNDQFIISSSENMYKISRLIDYMEKEINTPTSRIHQEMISPDGIGLERILWIYIQTFSKIKKLNLKTRIEGSYP